MTDETGARWVEVAPARICGWVADFAVRHGETSAEPGPAVVTLRGADGAVAQCHPPFPPLPGNPDGATDPDAQAERIAAHAGADRTVGVLLVRLGGYAAGIFSGRPPHLVASKTGSRLVHGRSAAGGWSQQRFARRREKQVSEALAAAATTALAVFGGFAGTLDAVVLGGDLRAITAVRADQRLRPFLDLAVDRFLTVPDPRLAVLRESPRHYQAVRIRLSGPVRP